MANDVIYQHHRLAENRAFMLPNGMAGKWLAKETQKVATQARLLAPKPGQGQGYATGETVLSIKTEGPTLGRRGPESTVVADNDHSLFVHEGTKPHIIRARYAPKMVFFWRKAGRVVYRKTVRHPGTRPNPFLLNALRAVFGGPGR